MNDSFPKVSIVVPVLNRERSIGRCLKSLVELDYPSFEVIVVDNGSTDKTPHIIKKYPVRLINEKIKGPYVARNAGLKASKGPLVLFIDSDCIARKDLLKNLVSELLKNHAAGVGGPILSHQPESIVEQFAHYAGIVQYSFPRGEMKRDKKKFLSGGIFTSNAMFRKDILDELGQFDSTLKSGGDFDLCWRLQRAGYQVYFTPDAVVYHIHRSDLKGLIKQFFKYGREQPKLLKKQPEGFSYMKVKTYLLDHRELSFKSPVRMLVNLDTCNLLPFSFVAALFSAPFLYIFGLLLLSTLLGTGIAAAKVVRGSGQWKWFILFPFFHLVRNYSFTAGRIWGGVKQKVISF